jgi:hypothetical protein
MPPAVEQSCFETFTCDTMAMASIRFSLAFPKHCDIESIDHCLGPSSSRECSMRLHNAGELVMLRLDAGDFLALGVGRRPKIDLIDTPSIVSGRGWEYAQASWHKVAQRGAIPTAGRSGTECALQT